ncbi:DUF6174 domain-containing protein [Streptomyces diastatochromogenes]|uniref:Lipoprotein n=1 Tax=Streptomyces diastatochromogenes TaxID=42236 RepID=A0A233S180_STRDA|nr:DUF6174 domain-containing protein [Streptomyces diastatochromogenes]MCZ0984928.1 DUF6174 domain-containing protein [Streptomyces diastatochromogenes]OXY89412.1 hypothetical protein BEK98_38225 [Streptomyces diastatochromogenes]
MRSVRLVPRSALPHLVLIAGLVWSTAACQEEAESGAAAQAESTAWKEPSAYTYTLKSTGGERLLIGTFRVTVREGRAVRVVGLDEESRDVVRRSPGAVPTIGGLLKELKQARRDGADTAEAEYSTTGYPRSITLDWSANAVDDEARYVISDYVAAH